MRPPTVRRSISAPSRGSDPPAHGRACGHPYGSRRGVGGPARSWRPPAPATAPRRRGACWPAEPDRCRPARGSRRSAGCRGRRSRDWSMSTALIGARLFATWARSAGSRSENASGPSRSSSGSSSTAPSRRGSRRYSEPPSANVTPKRCQAALSRCSRSSSGSPAASSSIRTRPLMPRCRPSDCDRSSVSTSDQLARAGARR